VGGWYLKPSLPPGCDWRGSPTREYIRASEGAFSDLNLTFDQLFLPFEEIQAAEQDWSSESEPSDTWSITSESTVPQPEEWYLQQEPAPFYWPLITITEPFYGLQAEPQFYWTISTEPLFYYTTGMEPMFYWSELDLAPDRFYILSETPQFYWCVFVEPAEPPFPPSLFSGRSPNVPEEAPFSSE